MNQKPILYGPDNPHPLSRFKTELVWEGKYDEYGNRRPIRLPITPLPLQRIERIDEPHDREKARQMKLFDESVFHQKAHRDDFRNMLIWGDNKYVMASLLQGDSSIGLEPLAGKIDLIYIDPPFATGQNFSYRARVGDEERVKEASIVEETAYRDTWGRGLESFLQMMYDRLVLMRELLSDDGSIMVHIGAEVSHVVRSLMEVVFGVDNFRNEIVLPGRAVKNLQQQFHEISRLQIRHDLLLWSSKYPNARFRPHWVIKHDPGNPEGHWHHAWSTADRPTMRYELLGTTPVSGQWVWSRERALQAVANYQRFVCEAGGRSLAQYWRDTGAKLEFIRADPKDGKPQYWRAPAEIRIADTVWSGIPTYSASQGYPTEKNEKLLEQVIALASTETSLVADFFCGSVGRRSWGGGGLAAIFPALLSRSPESGSWTSATAVHLRC